MSYLIKLLSKRFEDFWFFILNRKKNIVSAIWKGLKWLPLIIIPTVIGLYVNDYYQKQNAPEPVKHEVVIIPQNPTDSPTFPGYLDFPYIIQNGGNTRANNVKIKIIDVVPTKASMSPSMELIQDRDNLDGITEIQYNIEKLDPNESIIFWLSIKKSSYFNRLHLRPLGVGQKFSTKNITLPQFSYFKFDEGVGHLRNRAFKTILTQPFN